jgi:hypothetical protein
MPGTALQNFTDFVKFTGPAYYSSPDKFLNEAVKTTYAFSKFLKGKGRDKVIQSGENIKDDVMFDEARTFQNYQPNAEFTWTQPQVATEQSIEWRFSIDHMSWTDHEITLNMNSGYSKEYAATQYKRLRKKIEQRCWTSIINGLEEKLWATAGASTTSTEAASMETASGSEQYSLLSFITEDTTNYHCVNGGWTTIEGIDPATESKWRNQVSTYDYDDPDDSDGDGDGLIDKFDEMLTSVGFVPPDFHKEHFEGSNENHDSQIIFCSNGGLNLYKRMLRQSNDTLVRKTDASYSGVTFDGIQLYRSAQLGSVSHAWSTTTTAGTELGYATDGYRYFWVDTKYLTPVFHNERYFFKKDPFFLEKQPYTWVCPIDIWWNMFCHSRQRQGIVAPQ